jgi:histone H2B
MPPKADAQKKPASKAPVTASKAPEKKDAAGKKTAPTGEKKKRTKARKETYSSYIYKGELAHSDGIAWGYSSDTRFRPAGYFSTITDIQQS